jgi:hypothetical protein
MVARRAFTESVLAELGWLTILYSGLEDLLVTFIGGLVKVGDQEPARDIDARMTFQKKREMLKRLCWQRFPQAPPELLAAMSDALRTCEAAGTARNDLVHGLAGYDQGAAFMTRPGKTPQTITLERIQSVNALVFEAFVQTANALPPLYRSKDGELE